MLAGNYWQLHEQKRFGDRLKYLAPPPPSYHSVLQAGVCTLLSPINCDATKKATTGQHPPKVSLLPFCWSALEWV